MRKLLPELARYVVPSKLGGLMVHHPLVIELFADPKRAALINERFKNKTREVAAALTAGDFSRYIWLHERPYRLDGFLAIKDHASLSDARYWQLVGQIWMDTESWWQQRAKWALVRSSEDVAEERDGAGRIGHFAVST
jgi:hypothetical protein